MNQPTLTIPKPCHENWEGMTPEDKGRFCSMCQKTVIDFTEMAPAEIGHFFEEHKGQKICGRFRDDQLVQPKEPLLPEALVNRIASRPMGFRQMFVLALLVCMGSTLFSCHQTKGELNIETETPVDTNAAVTDSVNQELQKTGEVASVQDTVPPPPMRRDVVLGSPTIKQQDAKSHCKKSKAKDIIVKTVTGDVEMGITPPIEEPVHITGDTIVLPKQ
nr:hypothetical protein [uncultured Flavobacterium sp.]